MTPLDFSAQRDANSESFERADPVAALIERVAWNRWLVTLPDGDDAHEVRLERDHGAYVGECRLADSDSEFEEQERCPARKYNDDDKPCAHLCTLRKALVFNDEADDGTTIEVFDRDDVRRLVTELIEAGDVLSWHGLLAPLDDEHLTAIIESERQSGAPRTLLIKRINRLRAGESA